MVSTEVAYQPPHPPNLEIDVIRVFSGPTADHVWCQISDAFRESEVARRQDSRGGPTREILHAAISIENPRCRWVISRNPTIDVAFALAEIVWIIRGRRDLKFLEFWNRKLSKYVGAGPELHGSYGHRLRVHLGTDQLKRAYDSLRHEPNTRQVVLQIWDSAIDLPAADGSPADQDIPCNVASLLKVRDGKLEWTQIIRSNDVFLGVPYNFVQFTSLQEIVAGWMGIECGSYNQISDSLHVYEKDLAGVIDAVDSSSRCINQDSLALEWDESDFVFCELERRIERMIDPHIGPVELEDLSTWDSAPQSYRNILDVLVARALSRHRYHKAAERVIAMCKNPVYIELWRKRFVNSQMEDSSHFYTHSPFQNGPKIELDDQT